MSGNNGDTAVKNADAIIEDFRVLKDSINEKIIDMNNKISEIPLVDDKFFLNSKTIDDTKKKIAEYFEVLMDKKEKIDIAIIDLRNQENIINEFEGKKKDVLQELKDSAKLISEKRDALSPSTDNNNQKNIDLSKKMDNVQSRKSRVIDLNRGIKKLFLMVDAAAINKIEKTLNTKFFKLRYDLRRTIVTFYETLSGTSSGLLNAEVTKFTNNLSDTDKMSILAEINRIIKEMLKYVNFCKVEISKNKLGNITVNNLNNQSPNKNYNKTLNLLGKIDVLYNKLNNYQTELNKLRTRLKDNFEEELKALTKKIIDATDKLKSCIDDIYKTNLNFSSDINKKKISKHNLQEIEANAESMKGQMNKIKEKLNIITTNQTTKSNAKLVDIITKLETALGSNTLNTSLPNL